MVEKHPLDVALDLALNGDQNGAEAILAPLEDEDPRAKFNMGWHYLRRGKMLKGMECLTVGRWLNVFGSSALTSGKPIWRDESLLGKKLLFRGEGGFGDQFINLRFARDFKAMGAKVTVACHPSMFSLLRTVKYIDNLVEDSHAVGVDHDYWMPAMSAPLALGYEYEGLSGAPYIPKPRAKKLKGDFKVGIRWAGNPKFEAEQHRKFDPKLMLSLTEIEGIQFYSLQRDDDLLQLPESVIDLAPKMTGWLETAKLIAGLDLVITSCTSIAHLAGAMGVPTWVIVPVLPYYVWSRPGNKSPWYDTVAIYRQEKYGDWTAPFARIDKDLREKFK